jgi:hypothetical protein
MTPSQPRRPINAALPRDRSAIWLRNAAIGLCALATAADAVSFTAQYRMVYADRRPTVVAGLEAAIPDTAALIFACLGVALALHGRRALRARTLNVASVGASVFMNVIAAAPGWRSLAVWATPPAIARHKHLNVTLAAEEVTPLAVLGGLLLWLLRLSLAPASTVAGFRAWVLDECPVAPGRRAARPAPVVATAAPPQAISRSRRGHRAADCSPDLPQRATRRLPGSTCPLPATACSGSRPAEAGRCRPPPNRHSRTPADRPG